jgi:hypothetical protein
MVHDKDFDLIRAPDFLLLYKYTLFKYIFDVRTFRYG